MTGRQTDNLSRFLRLRRDLEDRLNVRVHGRNISLSKESAIRSVWACREFVYAFDGEVNKRSHE
jgi:hypothetical protein